MNIRYDTTKIKKIISEFAYITGISIALLDYNRVSIANYEYNHPWLCKKIQSFPEGKRLCFNCDKSMLDRCVESRNLISHTCHAGIVDSVMPIIKDNVVIGFIILGRTRKSDEIDDIYENIKWLGESKDNLKSGYLKISKFEDLQIQSIANLISDFLSQGAISLEFSEPVKSAAKYISENLSGDLSIAKLCEISHSSKNMLYKAFAEVFGCTVNEYITTRKTDYAKYLLTNTKDTIFEIGEKIGIKNSPQFCRMFKKHAGYTPGEYRKMFC